MGIEVIVTLPEFNPSFHKLPPDTIDGVEDNNTNGRPMFISDNPSFDFAWINYYFHRFYGDNPFGWSGKKIGDIYSGLVKDTFKASEWKKYRKTSHSHDPVDDAMGNAEALLVFKEKYGLKIKL